MEQGETQTIKFSLNANSTIVCNSGNNENNIGNGNASGTSHSNSVAVCSSDVVIEVGTTSHTSGSSAVASKNITKYPYEQLYIPGNLVAVHFANNFIAYAIKAPKTQTGMVRIMCRSTGVRGLIKNIPGLVKDISFAYLTSRILLGFTDQYGTLFVYEVHEDEDNLRTDLLLEVKRSESEETSDYQRLIWCPFIPDSPVEEEDQDDEDEENFAYLLVSTNGPVAVIWHVATIIHDYGKGLVDQSKVKPGPGRHYVMEQHSAPIVDAAFSPDGTALATAALDGYVKFFQVYLADDQSSPRCLHQWNPHDGRPLSCLFFLDNHKNPSQDVQFWKYAVTGACNNSEIKVWSCETWQCNQTITFESTDELNMIMPTLSLKAAIDPTSKYLILSDIHRRVLYVMILCQEPLPNFGNPATNGCNLDSSGHSQIVGKIGVAKVVSVTELPIQYPAISLTITSADWKPYKRWKHEHLMQDNVLECYEEDEDANDIDIVEGLVFKCVLINTQSLQDAVIRFQPTLPPISDLHSYFGISPEMNMSSSQDSMVLRDELTDLSLSLSTSIMEGEPLNHQRLSLPNQSSEKMDKTACLISFPSKSVSGSQSLPGSPSISGSVAAIHALSSKTIKDSISPLKLDTSISPLSISHLGGGITLSNNFDSSKTSEPVTMNLLTPESFSSPGRVEENENIKLESDLEKENNDTNRTPTPSGDLKAAAISLLMRNRQSSLSRLDSSESHSGSVSTPKSQDILPNILDTVISGSSRSPITILPPLSKGPSPIPDKNDAPLATSELSHPATDLSNSTLDILCNNSIPVSNSRCVVGLASSTSSPSLEVQQILHSHHDRNSEEYEDETGDEGHEVELAITNSKGDHSVDANILLDLPKSQSSILQKNSQNSLSVSPLCPITSSHLPMPPPSDALPHPMVSKSQPLPPSSASLPHPPSQMANISTEQPYLQNLININNNTSMLNQLKGSSQSPLIDIFGGMKFPQLNQFEKAVDVQPKISLIDQNEIEVSYKKTQEDIASLRQLILSCDSDQEERSQAILDQSRNLFSQMDKSLKSLTQLTKQIEDIRKTQNKMQEQLPQLLANTTRPIIENAIRQEVRNALTPALNKCLDPMKSHLMLEIKNLVANGESHISEGLSKTIYSRPFIDNINNSVSNALTAGVQTACRDAYNKIVLPGFNVATQQVFSQLNEAFTKGTREYMHHVESEAQITRTACLEQIAKGTRNLDTAATNLTSNTNTLVESLHKSITQQTSLSDTLGDRLRSLVHDETIRALQEHHASIEARASRAQTPAPLAHTPINPKIAQQQVQQLISQGQFNAAFKQALSASDLSLVVFVCERINPQQLFSQTTCPLSQDVLLSLVNQLAHDLSTFTDLKTKYLEESVLNIDTSHPVTREHMRLVFLGVQSSLKSYLAQNPNHKKLKMLLMAVNHLVDAQS